MNEKKIILSILSGNINDFERIIKQYEHLVYHIINRLINNTQDKEELYQEIFLKIYNNLNSFRFQSKLSTWIGKIAYNTTVNFLGKIKNTIIDYSEITEPEFAIQQSNNSSPQNILEKKDRSRIIKESIDNLSEKYKMILTLYHIDEFSYSEISNIMNMPEGTVKNYLFRARKLLKEKISVNYCEEDL